MPLLVEYRIPLPLSVEEFNRAWLYMCVTASCDATLTAANDEGVVIVENHPYDNTNGQMGAISTISEQPIPRNKGQYTLKEYRLGSRVPGFARAFLPTKALILVEEAFNAYPHCVTYLTNGWLAKHKFYISVRTKCLAGNCSVDNAHELDNDELKKRKVKSLDPATPDKENDEYRDHLDPSTFHSLITGRGPLIAGHWMKEADPCMTCYKVVDVCCDSLWPMGGTAERAVIDGMVGSFTNTHGQAICTIDQWFNFSIEDIRILEEICEKVLAADVASRSSGGDGGGGGGGDGGGAGDDDGSKAAAGAKKECVDDSGRTGNPLFIKIMEVFQTRKKAQQELAEKVSAAATEKAAGDANMATNKATQKATQQAVQVAATNTAVMDLSETSAPAIAGKLHLDQGRTAGAATLTERVASEKETVHLSKRELRSWCVSSKSLSQSLSRSTSRSTVTHASPLPPSTKKTADAPAYTDVEKEICL